MKQNGTLLVFNENVDLDQVRKHLDAMVADGLLENYNVQWSGNKSKLLPYVIREFDNAIGGPVWYMP